MENLIPITNKLQEVFSTVGAEVIQLPQIIIVGTQSSGKSSVIEGIVGRSFLPKGMGTVTRRPLMLQLVYSSGKSKHQGSSDNALLQYEEYGKFVHKGNEIFTDFNEIREEILRETEKLVGPNKGISPEPIILKIYSPNVVNLTLVDLPGLTKVPVGDQPEDIETQIRELVLQYIKNPNSIILAVVTANTDMATNESLQLAKQCDPDGRRTLAVVTKLDLMDAGTDASDILCGRVIPVKLGIIGVVNRSQQDIQNNKSISDAIKDEAVFLQRKYPNLAQNNGTPFLAKTLNTVLMQHISNCLPFLKQRIDRMILQYQKAHDSFGHDILDKRQELLRIITEFASSYCATIEGTATQIETNELCGGARISYIFHETFRRAMDSILPLADLSNTDILTAIRNAAGTKPAIFIPEISFELLVKRQIRRLREPALRCVQLIHEEMQRIIHHCGSEIKRELARFPKLQARITNVTTQLLKRRLPDTNQMVENLIAIELAYINTRHPDFNADSAIACSTFGVLNAKSYKSISVCPAERENKRRNAIENVKNSREENRMLSANSVSNKGNQNYDEINPAAGKVVSTHLQNMKRTYSSQNLLCATASNTNFNCEKEEQDCEMIQRLIETYFHIVRKSIQDSIPKAVMHFMVNYVKENLQSELTIELYNADLAEELITEAEYVTQRRNDMSKMLKALHEANSIIAEIHET